MHPTTLGLWCWDELDQLREKTGLLDEKIDALNQKRFGWRSERQREQLSYGGTRLRAIRTVEQVELELALTREPS